VPDPPPYAHGSRATALAPGGAVFVSLDIDVHTKLGSGVARAVLPEAR
jgi:hypothetical protein